MNTTQMTCATMRLPTTLAALVIVGGCAGLPASGELPADWIAVYAD